MLVVTLLFILVADIVFIVGHEPREAIAQANPFGGQSTNVYYCNCSFNYRIMVSPPVGGTFMYQPGATTLYQFGQIYRTGVWLLGLTGGSVSCMVYSGKSCTTLGTYPMMTMVGTSM
jgi:hypothetical protein